MQRKLPVDSYLEQNYNLQARRDDLADVLQRWSDQSEEFRKNAEASISCQHGPGDRDRVDVFRCGEVDAPLYVYIHGGYWQRGDKSVYSFIAEPFIEAQVDVAIIGYPLCPQVSMTELVECIRTGLAWLYRNAQKLGVNASRINLSGHSAGGQLTTLGLCTTWSELADDLPSNLLKSGIPLSGLYQLEPLRHTTIDDALHLTDSEVRKRSPPLLTPSSDAPVLAVLGGAETPEFFRQTDELVESWTNTGVTIEKFVEPAVDHFDLVDRLANPDSGLFRRIRDWLR